MHRPGAQQRVQVREETPWTSPWMSECNNPFLNMTSGHPQSVDDPFVHPLPLVSLLWMTPTFPISYLKFFFVIVWLCWVLVAVCEIFDLHCSMRTLSFGIWVLVPWSGSKPGPLALGVQSLSPWTTREVPQFPTLTISSLYLPVAWSLSFLLTVTSPMFQTHSRTFINTCWKEK